MKAVGCYGQFFMPCKCGKAHFMEYNRWNSPFMNNYSKQTMIVIRIAAILFGVNFAQADDYTYWSLGATTGNLYGLYWGSYLSYGYGEQSCKDKGWKNLVYITSYHIHNEIADLMLGAADYTGDYGYWSPFIGMTDYSHEGLWKWNDDIPVVHQNWGPGQPDNHRRNEDCGSLEWPMNWWNDIDCGERLPYICFQEPSTASRSSIDNRLFSIRNFDGGIGTQELARSSCEKVGLRLAVVDSDEVITKIENSRNPNSKVGYWVDGTQNCLNAVNCEGLTSYVREDVFPLALEPSSQNEDYMVGDTIKIECTSSVVSTVKWQKQEGAPTDNIWMDPLQNIEPRKATLIIKSATQDDSAKYRCTANKDIIGQSRAYATFVNIRVHPEK